MADDGPIGALILAGGRSSRFGSEKAMADLEGQPLIAHVLGALAVADRVAVSARPDTGAAAWALERGLDLLPDPDGAPDGPLSGVREGLRWAGRVGLDRLLVVPCDTPRLTAAILETLLGQLSPPAHLAMAETSDGLQPLVSAWRGQPALDALESLMAEEAHPPVRALLPRLQGVRVMFPSADPFLNANRREELGRGAS